MKKFSGKSAEKLITAGIPVIFILGSLLHFLYDLSGENTFAAIISAVNESIWEHMKLMVLPVILWWTGTYIYLRKTDDADRNRWFSATAAALITGLFTIPSLYYLYTGATGKSALWADILIFFIASAAAQLAGLHIYKYGRGISPAVSIGIIIIIVIIFAVFTFYPPKLPIFTDFSVSQ